ncbi:actinia tenebrosa protease inhibitors-like [Daphnia pulicaria]|uniref:actinia tenebrosa protease inhibitors-like n=1 Tax=Daphnia pulicaria TaxID=35523 RepID=UPI001EEAC937|nr:actinia tenebrosa protease inhibitors-like [Daphnia pulicaria]XP_046635248.1 actinia tenebrosa protease inhibitors-like [Daphnia pulicaria]
MLRVIFSLLCATSIVFAIPYPATKRENNEEVDICALPPVNPGSKACRGFFRRWTYDIKTETCAIYIYGGCGGTENLFHTEFSCLAKCNKPGLQKLISKSDLTAPCMQPKAEGLCRAVIPSFYFDVQTGKCTMFDYSGCHGNSNRFATEEECEQECYDFPNFWQNSGIANSSVGLALSSSSDSQANAEDEVDVCSLRVVNPGPKRCKINTQRRWTYSAKTKACEIFEYIPCTSKDPPNLFFNEYACLASCNQQGLQKLINESDPTSPCMQPKAAGNCRGSFHSFYFDKKTGMCTTFTYTGCGGNVNQFSSEEECYLKCNNVLHESDSITVDSAPFLAPDETNVEIIGA